MTRRSTLALLTCLGIGSGVLAAMQEQQPRPLFRGGARFVRVDVYPAGPDGKPVTGLTAADFEVFEDGKPQQIDAFDFVEIVPEPEEARRDPNTQREGEEWAKDPRARVFVVTLDKWHSALLSGARMRQPVIQMLDRLIGPRDVFGVTTPQMRAADLVLGRKTLTVADMLRRHWVWGARDSITERDQTEEFFSDCFGDKDMPRDPTNPHSNPALTAELVLRQRERETLEHLSALVEKLGAIRDEKKAVVVITEGWRQFRRNTAQASKLPNDAVPGIYSGGGRVGMGSIPRTAPAGTGVRVDPPPDVADCYARASSLLLQDNRQYFKDLLDRAQRANVSFYPVDPRGLAASDEAIAAQPGGGNVITDMNMLRMRLDGLEELASNTDGIALIHSNDLLGTLKKFADSLSTYYLLGYYSSNTKADGGYRRIQVKVKQPNVSLKARRGYFAPTKDEMDAILTGRAVAATPPAAAEGARSAALARLDQLRHDRDVFVQATRAADALVVSVELGSNPRQSSAWIDGGEVRVTVASAAGTLEERARVEANTIGSIIRFPMKETGEIRIQVQARAAAAGPYRAADDAVTLPAAPASLIGDVLSYRGLARALMPAAEGRYRRTERATIEAPLTAGAAPVGARVLDRAGRPINVPVTMREKNVSGQRWISAEVSLAPLADGDYLVELEAMKDASRETKLFAIRVTR